MKKVLLILCLILCCTKLVMADDASTSSLSDAEWCPHGNILRGYNQNKRYCGSKKNMNWYTAMAWCQIQGMHLASVAELCDKGDAPEDKWDGNLGLGRCKNVTGLDGTPSGANRFWSSTIDGETQAISPNFGMSQTTRPELSKVLRSANKAALCY